MVTRPLLDHPSQSSLVALASLFVLGATLFILDNFKRNQSDFFKIYDDDSKSRKPIFLPSQEFLEEGCDVFDGEWVWDDASHPLYREEECSYLLRYTACQRTGRPDSLYQNWRWQPRGCNLPRFDPLKLLNMLRGKRLMFVGDSVQRNQFDSMICMVESVIPKGKRSFGKFPPSMATFKTEEFNVSIEFYWAPFIVDSISDDAENHTVRERFVHLDSIGEHGESWKGVDVLVFDSYAWWFFKPLVSAVYHGDMKEYKFGDAYRLALGTWANWLQNNINPGKQQVFFMSLSPTHWGPTGLPGGDGNCFNETQPNTNLRWDTDINLQMMKITRDVLQETKINITLLNITQLSEYRVDAHTTLYGEHKGKPLTKEQRADPKNYADCLHWCLPGVPDTWNEILYAYLLRNHQKFL